MLALMMVINCGVEVEGRVEKIVVRISKDGERPRQIYCRPHELTLIHSGYRYDADYM